MNGLDLKIMVSVWRHQRERKDAEIRMLRHALQRLYDEQNGPPLIKHQRAWERAMDEAKVALEMTREPK